MPSARACRSDAARADAGDELAEIHVGHSSSAQDANVAADKATQQQLFQVELRRVLNELEGHGLLSDQRAAQALVQAKAARFGSRRLKQMLQARSLDPELVSDALQQTRSTEFERAHNIWQRRFGTAATDPTERARQQRFLLGRGFDVGVISRVLKGAGLDAADDAERPDAFDPTTD
jgi:SOS response regulatory protein OraA/RecX